jgi:hypothetical protein
MNHEQRLKGLEHTYQSTEQRAITARIAEETGISPAALEAEAERIMCAAGPPYTLERLAAVVTAETGQDPAQLIAHARAGIP